jgi:hypothetical protein
MPLIVRTPAPKHEALRGVLGGCPRTVVSDFLKPTCAELIHYGGNLWPQVVALHRFS